MGDRLPHMISGIRRSLAWAACVWLTASSGCAGPRSAGSRAMAKLHYGMLLPELQATMRAEGGTLERVESLGEPVTARYYRFGDELLRVEGGSCLYIKGESFEYGKLYKNDDLVFIDWHVTDYYIYTPEAEQRRLKEHLEMAKRPKQLFPPSNAPPRSSPESKRTDVP